MSNQPFVHLHFHTEYSLLDGACRVEEVMEAAQRMGMPAVAITDHGVLYGAVDFYKSAKAKGIKPILGCEVYMAPEGTTMRERKKSESGSQSNHLVLLAENETGYRNLSHLVSQAHLEGFYYKPRIDRDLLSRHSQGLIGLSACLKGEIPEMAVRGNLDGAVRRAEEYREILGRDHFFIELQDHGIPEQRLANEGLLEVARRTGLPLVATNDVHYLSAEHYEAHDVMICLQTQTVMSDPKRMRYGSTQFFMKSAEQMSKLFPEYPEALANTLLIAQRCNVELRLGKELHFPQFQVPEGYTQKSYLNKIVAEGLKRRYGVADVEHPRDEREGRIVDRYLQELEVIEKTGFINYFLVVWDFVRFARDCCIPVGPGRGSGAGSIVAYALGITGIDPLRYNLFFERFLNPDRVSPPDFDIDFCQNRRGEVIEYVKQKYGRENVAQIITFGTLGAKMVIRDIGRVLEVPLSECDRLAKMVPDDPGTTLADALRLNPDFKKAVETEEHARKIYKYARVLEGLPRNPGTHAAGVVIGEKPLHEIIPLCRDKNQEVITQFEMKPLEMTGLLKMDFLGLRTLTLIQEAVENVRKIRQVELNVDDLPMDDPATLDLLNRADTVGIFQVESKGMRDLLRRIGLSRFEDLIAMIALFRPGPMNMLDDFVDRKHGKIKIVYDHPLMEPILKETYGVMLYQEQVMQVTHTLAGFTLGQGDILRRAMGKKIMEEMSAMREKFIAGCQKTNKIPRETADRIFSNIERFANYGFNKSHSAAYAILSFQTAYLKAHYPVEFMAALLSSEMNNTDKLPLVIAEAQQMDIRVLPPNVNDSDVRFTPAPGGQPAIRFGLAGVKNVGVGAVEAIVRERQAGGPFTGLVDFSVRMDSQVVNKKVLESLVKCGAFDFTGLHRARLFGGIEFALNRAASFHRDRRSGQTSLFELLGAADNVPAGDELPEAARWPDSQLLAEEKDLLGFYISGHPLAEFEWVLQKYNLAAGSQLEELPDGTVTRIGGLVTGFQKKFTKRTQEPMGIFRLEHLDGVIEVVVFPEPFREYGVHLVEGAPVMVCGQINRAEALKLKAWEIYPLRDVHRHFTERLSIHLSPSVLEKSQTLGDVKEILRRHRGDTPVFLCLQFPSGEKVFLNTERACKVAPSAQLIREVEQVVGEESVYLAVTRKACKSGNGSGPGRRWGNNGGG
jgi:DNA polymerase-3 subunit alpha